MVIQALVNAKLILKPQDIEQRPEYMLLVKNMEESFQKVLQMSHKKEKVPQFLWGLFWAMLGAVLGIILVRLIG